MPRPRPIRRSCPLVCVAVFLFSSQVSALPADPLRVDLSPDNGRGDVVAPKAAQWRFADAQSASQSFPGVTITLNSASESDAKLRTAWWKAGFDYPAALASDGVTGDRIEMRFHGLRPGRHSLTTFHNSLDDAPAGRIRIAVEDQDVATVVTSTSRVLHDDDAASAWLEFEAFAGRDVRVIFAPDDDEGNANVILNGFVIDGVDPSRQANWPSPADDDEHVPPVPVLTWRPSSRAIAHRVYLGTDPQAVRSADVSSPEFAGTVDIPESTARADDPFADYYWRVDEVEGDEPGDVVRGAMWRFRVRRLAFPGAEGYGRFAAGGRGGRVIEVTSLADSGPGTLRAAVEAEGPRTVEFRVGGTIRLESKLIVRHPYLTVAGQTAPGDGICVRGYTFGCLGAHDVIIRYIRIRVGDEAGVTMDGTGFASTDHSIMDHCSVSWSIDESLSSRGAGNITVQRCLIAEALNVAGHKKYEPGKGHSFAASISGNVGSFHHNLLAHCAGRNWSLAGGLDRGVRYAGRLDVRNNVVFNWAHRTTDGGAKTVNFVNNFYLPGPASRVFHLVKPDAGSPDDPQQYFIAGNVMEGHSEFNEDNWSNGGVVIESDLLPRVRLAEPFCDPHVTTDTAVAALDSVLSDVGANYPAPDAVDRRILDEVRDRRATFRGSRSGLPGIIDSQADVGGWPELNAGTPPQDSDHDGLPDAWETTHRLNPHDTADAALDRDGDRYTELEEYLNSLVP